ncbi:sugar phosphate isomerase/epimerase family protein [Sporomusa aerivorans]|uniref:sugar phosphate isomerase/epimerase family protein n=1 Tax=Sporomusa aerivorans TaxID=204936 RepID=UPI00352A808A
MPQFSIFSWFGFPVPMEERFKLIKMAGFEGVLLWWSDEHAAVDGDKSLQPEMARRNGLFIENIHTPIEECINGLWTNSAAGDEFERILSGCIVACAEHAIPTAVVHVSRGDNPPPPSQIGLDRIKRLLETAERKNINIALENLRKPEFLDFIFSNIQSDRLGFCYDSGHENCYTPGADFLAKYGSKLMALHLHDNDGTDDYHQIPGEGSIDWSALLKKISGTGYGGAIALEVANKIPLCGETPASYLKKAFGAAQKLVNYKEADQLLDIVAFENYRR